MRVLVYGINYAPELTGVGKYTGEMCEWLRRRGHDVTVVCAPPYYPAWHVIPPYRSWQYSVEVVAGVRVIRCPLWVPKRQTALLRALHLFSFAVSSFPVVILAAFRGRPDTVFFIVPTFVGTVAALVPAYLVGARSWLHIQDYEAEAAFSLGMLRASWMKRIIAAVERSALRLFDCVSTISPSMLELTRTKGVSPDRLVHFPNWVDTASIRPLSGPSPLRQSLGIGPDQRVALYSGNLGEKQGLEIVVDAARTLRERKDVLFVICGEGAARERLGRRAAGLENVRFVPLQPAERLNELLNLADIHLLPQRQDVDCFVMPSKLLGMMASGRPIVASARHGSDLSNTVCECGLVVPPGDGDGFARAVIELLDNPERAQGLGVRARELCIDKWDVSETLTDLERSLLKLLDAKTVKLSGDDCA